MYSIKNKKNYMKPQRIVFLHYGEKRGIKRIHFKLNFQLKFIIILIFEQIFHTDKNIKICDYTSHFHTANKKFTSMSTIGILYILFMNSRIYKIIKHYTYILCNNSLYVIIRQCCLQITRYNLFAQKFHVVDRLIHIEENTCR